MKKVNGIFSLQPMPAFVQETDKLIQADLRSGNTHPEGRGLSPAFEP
jgi:hypothetical protein